jgi:hypothetical protein
MEKYSPYFHIFIFYLFVHLINKGYSWIVQFPGVSSIVASGQGLKKVESADTLTDLVDPVLDHPTHHPPNPP